MQSLSNWLSLLLHRPQLRHKSVIFWSRTSLRKSIEVFSCRLMVFLLYFHDTFDVNIWEVAEVHLIHAEKWCFAFSKIFWFFSDNVEWISKRVRIFIEKKNVKSTCIFYLILVSIISILIMPIKNSVQGRSVA